MATGDPKIVMPYGRQPAARHGCERLRKIEGNGNATLVIFPPGFWGSSSRWGLIVIAGGACAMLPTVLRGHTHVLLLLAFLAAVWGGTIWSDWDDMCRQLEIDIGPDELLCISFGRKRTEERRWPRACVRDTKVRRFQDGTSKLSLVEVRGQEHELLRGEHDLVEEVTRLLKEELAKGVGFTR